MLESCGIRAPKSGKMVCTSDYKMEDISKINKIFHAWIIGSRAKKWDKIIHWLDYKIEDITKRFHLLYMNHSSNG